MPAIAGLIPPPIYFSQVPVGVAVGQNISPSLSQLKRAGLGLRKPPEWEVERKKSKGREASQEMPGCSDCTSRDSCSLAQSLESPRQGLWTWVGNSASESPGVPYTGIRCQSGLPLLPDWVSAMDIIRANEGSSLLWSFFPPLPITALFTSTFTAPRTVYSAILIIETGLMKPGSYLKLDM